MSRESIVIERILNALKDDHMYHQNLLCRTTAPASFGLVQIAMFIMSVADNELNAEMVERRIIAEMQLNKIYVAFHKTRRQDGERLVTVTKPLEPKHPNFTYGNLQGFTKLWLIDATDARRAVTDLHEQRKNKATHITIAKR